MLTLVSFEKNQNDKENINKSSVKNNDNVVSFKDSETVQKELREKAIEAIQEKAKHLDW